jgi:hypothetical protein
MSARYPNPSFARLALAPGLLAAIVLLAGVALVESEWFTIFRYAISILAAIVAVFAFQARQWWWLPAFAAIVVLWNPIVPLEFDLLLWQILHLLAAVLFVAAGLLIKVPQAPDPASSRR